jgi:hypothetical protein
MSDIVRIEVSKEFLKQLKRLKKSPRFRYMSISEITRHIKVVPVQEEKSAAYYVKRMLKDIDEEIAVR